MTKDCDSTCSLRAGRAKAKRHLATVVDRFSPHSTGRTTTANIAAIFACKCSRHRALSRCSLQAWWLDSACCTFARHVLPYPSSSLRLPVCRNFTHAACHQHAVMSCRRQRASNTIINQCQAYHGDTAVLPGKYQQSHSLPPSSSNLLSDMQYTRHTMGPCWPITALGRPRRRG